jgi:hypothetical protein
MLEAAGLDCVEQGYLRVPVALQALQGGDLAAAHAGFSEIVETVGRFGDPGLTALGRLGCGQALVTAGEIARGTRMLDEAMLAVTTGEVSPILAGTIYCGVIIACQQAFDLRRAQEWTAALSRWCAAQPDLKPYRGQCLVHRSEIMQLRGDWTDAMEEVRQACEHLADACRWPGPAGNWVTTTPPRSSWTRPAGCSPSSARYPRWSRCAGWPERHGHQPPPG